jgi:hypothetical protein
MAKPRQGAKAVVKIYELHVFEDTVYNTNLLCKNVPRIGTY